MKAFSVQLLLAIMFILMGNLRLEWLKFIFQALDEIKLNNQKNKKDRTKKTVRVHS